MMIRVKKLREDAKLPTTAYMWDAGYDLYCVEDEDFSDGEFVLKAGKSHTFHTGIQCAFPPEYVALIWDRSGLACKNDIHRLAGVIDGGYRGEWMIHLVNLGERDFTVSVGDKIAQFIIQSFKKFTIVECEELGESERRTKGFGSSDKGTE